MKVLIIGGVAGGASAAARLRRLDEDAEIVILERTGYVSYANCGLPYYVGGVITERGMLTLQTPEECLHFFEDLCTVSEIQEMSRRLQAARMLSHNHSTAKLVSAWGGEQHPAFTNKVTRFLAANSTCDDVTTSL